MAGFTGRFWRELPYLIIIAGCAIRVLHGMFRLEMIYPDEHFQTLEPANWVINGYGHLAWEYQWGARSWLTPALYMPILKLLQWLGDTGSPFTVGLCRSWNALWHGLVGLALYHIAFKCMMSRFAAIITIAVFAFIPSFALFGAASFQETWATVGIWMILAGVFRGIFNHIRTPWYWGLLGLASGLLFGVRFQSLIWSGMIFLTWCLAFKPAKSNWLGGIAGGIIGIVSVGVLDYLTWGHLFHSVKTYYQVNIVQGFLKQFGESPWYDYFVQLHDSLSPALAWPLFGSCMVGLYFMRRFHRYDWLVLAPAIVFFVFHSAIGHKELRFVSPAFPAFVFVAVRGLQLGWKNWFGPRTIQLQNKIYRKFNQSVQAQGFTILGALLTIVIASYFSHAAMHQRRHYLAPDVTRLQAALHQLMQDESIHPRCIIMYGIDWTWTRFDMIMGRSIVRKSVERDDLVVDSPELRECDFAIVSVDWKAQWLMAADKTFEPIARNRRRDILFRVRIAE
jgi:hypothetical protein